MGFTLFEFMRVNVWQLIRDRSEMSSVSTASSWIRV